MSSIWGEHIKLSVFGESHGPAIGAVIDGLPPGIKLDIDKINKEMDRRKPGTDTYSTPRKESDKVEIISGFFKGYTTGTPLCAIIWNTDKRSKDYDGLKDMMRPGHADFTGKIRYMGFNDYRGGGHFSGRLTAPIVFAGAIAAQYIDKWGISIGTHILRIGKVEDIPIDPVNISDKQLKKFRNMRFPVLGEDVEQKMKAEINAARMELDSVGGMLETAIVNLPAGLGSPIFKSVESRISAFVFSIPATKGIEFGSGFKFASMRGSEANDQFNENFAKTKDMIACHSETDSSSFDSTSGPHCPLTATNHTGGINGGITNGMPVIFRTAFRPTPSVGKPQKFLNINTGQVNEYTIHGRHDPCIAVRAVPVLDAVAALVAMDLLLENTNKKFRENIDGV